MNGDIFTNLLPSDDFLVQHSGGASRELVVPLLLLPDIWRDEVPHQCGLFLGDDSYIHVASGTQVVEDTSLDGIGAELDRIVSVELVSPLRLEDRHGSE